MTIRTARVGAAVTPTVIKTYISHYAHRKSRHQRPTAHISYDEGLHLIRAFLEFTSHRTVEELQAFTAQSVPPLRWVKVDHVTVPTEQVTEAAEVLIDHLGPHGLDRIGGSKWWQWRPKGVQLKADWIEMRAHYNERQKLNEKGTRVMLYVHGGAYFFGSVDEHRYIMQRQARKLKARVFAPRYRLAPQFPFPCGLQDCLAAYLYLLTLQDPTEIILAGDSAGGGMIISILCILRDHGLPLPAGGILLSPWVDTTHSFPSLSGDEAFDYIPPRGFMAKPSAAWPPPNDEEILEIAKGAIGVAAGTVPSNSPHRKRNSAEKDAVQGFAVVQDRINEHDETTRNPNNPAKLGQADGEVRAGDTIPGPGHQLSIEIDGKLIRLIDQIQMYTTNQLLSHPLVSPVLQPSLGGLPPLLIMTGGGELLRDEQIYLAHKAANPGKYRLGDAYHALYDHNDEILKRWNKPTPVQLQVWDDLCHVAPTLSFTRPAKFMYRSIAQFGAWALARAQGKGMEIMDDDDISVISSGSDTETEAETDSQGTTDSITKQKILARITKQAGHVGKAGDPLPVFTNHMIRQRVDRHGNTYPLAPESELPALQMDRNEIGVIKPGPVRKWMEGKKEWDRKYAKLKRKVQKQKIREMSAGIAGFGAEERPPPSALAGRRGGNMEREGKPEREKKSMGLMMWSGWGSRHDESTLQREERAEAGREGQGKQKRLSVVPTKEKDRKTDEKILGKRASSVSTAPPLHEAERSVSRRRTVVDEGQLERGSNDVRDRDDTEAGMIQGQRHEGDLTPATSAHLTPFYMPKFKSKHKDSMSHLRTQSKDDASSIRTANTGAVDSDNVSTTAVFAVPGVMKSRERKTTNSSSLLAADPVSPSMDEDGGWRSEAASLTGTKRGGGVDTPASQRSVERLESHQIEPEEKFSKAYKFRSPSSVAIVGAAGVSNEVSGVGRERSGGLEDMDNGAAREVKRPGMYDRGDTTFKTALESL